jgi:hypothetical protein
MQTQDTALIPLRASDGSVRAYTTVDSADADWVNQWTWRPHPKGYASRHDRSTGTDRIVLLHRALLGLTHGDGFEGDHINRDRLDNRRANLRKLPKNANQQNTPSKRGSSSIYRGVTKHRNRWQAVVTTNGRRIHLGSFTDEHEAGRAALLGRQRYLPYSQD